MHIFRQKLLLGCCLLAALFYGLFVAHDRYNPGPSVAEKVYSDLFSALEKHKPIDAPKNMREAVKQQGCNMKGVGVNKGDDVSPTVYENLDACFRPSKAQFEGLQAPHTAYLAALRSTFNYQNEPGVFNELFPNDKGFVTVGGGRFSLLSYTMIRTMRERGSTLPIEVVIPPQDEKGEEHFCQEILPKLNGRCVFFGDTLPPSIVEDWKFKSYQIKVMALLLSSFKKIVFIDADDLPLKNLDDVFESKVFKKNGLVLWPDLWRRMTAPVFYRLANIDTDLTKRVRNLGDDISPVSRYLNPNAKEQKPIPFHDFAGTIPDPTTESGQMVIDKVRHFQTLLLALYYNVYGPDWYYALFSQGTAGEGDKETFASAAHVLELPYYQVRTKLSFDGYSDPKDGGFRGVALYQHDCTQDYETYEQARELVKSQPDKYSAFKEDYDSEPDFYQSLMKPEGKPEVEVMFAHASFHKFDPWQLFKEKVYLNEDGTQFRSFRRLHRIKHFDIELFNFEVLEEAMCSEQPIRFRYFEDKFKREEWPKVCQYVKDRVEYLKKTHDEAVKKT